MAMTNAERQARLKAKRADAGLVQINLWVPAGAADELMRAAELMRANPDLRVARLVNRATGKLTGLKPAAKSAPAATPFPDPETEEEERERRLLLGS
jgi:hypothetical protein